MYIIYDQGYETLIPVYRCKPRKSYIEGQIKSALCHKNVPMHKCNFTTDSSHNGTMANYRNLHRNVTGSFQRHVKWKKQILNNDYGANMKLGTAIPEN